MYQRFDPATAAGWTRLLVLGLALAATGCGDDRRATDPYDSGKGSPGSNSAPGSAGTKKGGGGTAAPIEPTIASVSIDEVNNRLRKQRGKLVLLLVWKVNDEKSEALLERVVQLHKKHSKDRLTCASVAVLSKPDVALKALKKQEAVFPNFYVKETGRAQEQWRFAFPPALRLLDRKGTLIETIGDESTIEDVQAAIKKHLP